jgi:bifunctional DNA-binding transcriptional regulator/antitoxin component of YhaV-PrlF toxin-antitoxin module
VGPAMEVATLTAKGQITVPKAVCDALGLPRLRALVAAAAPEGLGGLGSSLAAQGEVLNSVRSVQNLERCRIGSS